MRALFPLVLMLLGACNREPDFSERYDAASKQIGTSAKKLDLELEKRAKQAGRAENSTDPLPAAGQDSGSPRSKGP